MNSYDIIVTGREKKFWLEKFTYVQNAVMLKKNGEHHVQIVE